MSAIGEELELARSDAPNRRWHDIRRDKPPKNTPLAFRDASRSFFWIAQNTTRSSDGYEAAEWCWLR